MEEKEMRSHLKEDKAYFSCQKNGNLNEIQTKNKRFLLIVLLSGELGFWIEEEHILAEAPCCICFDESENRRFDDALDAEYYSICFQPEFLDGILTLDFLRSSVFKDVTQAHELILLEPFFRKRFRILQDEKTPAAIGEICAAMEKEMTKEKEMYRYFICRSYFMEILIALERLNKINKKMTPLEASIQYVCNDRLKEAIRYIENHYPEKITLKDIAVNCGLNHTTLTVMMKQEMGRTPMDYLLFYRIKMAKKLLEHSELSIKEVAGNCGFKTTEHFSRVFKESSGRTPGEFRESKWKARK